MKPRSKSSKSLLDCLSHFLFSTFLHFFFLLLLFFFFFFFLFSPIAHETERKTE